MTDSLVTCDTCGTEERVEFAHCLRHGWPICCGYTMRLIYTDADIEKTTAGVIGAQMEGERE